MWQDSWIWYKLKYLLLPQCLISVSRFMRVHSKWFFHPNQFRRELDKFYTQSLNRMALTKTYESKSAASWTNEWRVCLRAGAISKILPLQTANTWADTRESKKFSVPTSIRHDDVFHDDAEGKFVSTMLFHFSKFFFTDEGRPAKKKIFLRKLKKLFSALQGQILVKY